MFLCEVSPGVLLLDLAAEVNCFCTLELASSTIEVEGEFLCGSITRARSHLQFYC